MEDVPTSVLTHSLGMNVLAMMALLSALIVITALVRKIKSALLHYGSFILCNSKSFV